MEAPCNTHTDSGTVSAFQTRETQDCCKCPFSQVPPLVLRALPGNQKASSGLIHVLLTSEEGLVLVSDASEGHGSFCHEGESG